MSKNTELPLWRWSATQLAQAIREKRLSSQEVVQAHLDRIAVVNPKVNAVTRVLEDEALRGARAADARIASGDEVGPLHGLPITVKECVDLVGTPTTHGIVQLKESLPERDAAVVAHLKDAGAIPIGRTNLPDFGLRWHTDNDLHGPTRNPWDASRTPGGSSGGEAAAIACGMSPLGVGNDMGGSLRYPAHCCGIAAIKPSFGRVSRIATAMFSDPPMFYEQVASINGPMARHIADLRLALEVMSRPDPDDPCWTPAPRLGSEVPLPLRIAMTLDPAGDGVDPQIAEGIRMAARSLEAAGFIVEEIDPPLIEEAARTVQEIADMEVKSYLSDLLPMVSADGATALKGILAAGGTTPNLTGYMTAIGTRHRIAAEWNLFLDRYPLILGPVSTHPPFEVGDDLAGVEAVQRLIRSLVLTETCNLLGLPSVAVPLRVADGLPLAVQVIGKRYHEDLCLDAAEIIEGSHGVFTPIEPRA